MSDSKYRVKRLNKPLRQIIDAAMKAVAGAITQPHQEDRAPCGNSQGDEKLLLWPPLILTCPLSQIREKPGRKRDTENNCRDVNAEIDCICQACSYTGKKKSTTLTVTASFPTAFARDVVSGNSKVKMTFINKSRGKRGRKTAQVSRECRHVAKISSSSIVLR